MKNSGETNIQEQVTIKPNQPGAKNVRIDMTSNKNGVINLTEAKSSSTAPLTKIKQQASQLYKVVEEQLLEKVSREFLEELLYRQQQLT
ncbi:hypothetical protein [Chryseobacterium indologenes]|uniref:hypothetical protein n=1 Tax=Chryseobacterium indologenes TaxID=253 RepID=UPI004057EF75